MLIQSAKSLGFFSFAQNSLPLLLESVPDAPHPPSLIVTGATASLRGGATFGTFAAGKFALRALSQSLAREFGPKGVHVAHVIVDGVIDIPRTKGYNVNSGVADGKISADAVSLARPVFAATGHDILTIPLQIADNYWYLHSQHRSAFTYELDLRPYVEKF